MIHHVQVFVASEPSLHSDELITCLGKLLADQLETADSSHLTPVSSPGRPAPCIQVTASFQLPISYEQRTCKSAQPPWQ